MYNLLPDDPRLTLICVDPGTNTLGLSVISLNPITKKSVILKSCTLVGSKLAKHDYSVRDLIYDSVPNKHQRLNALSNELVKCLYEYMPDMVIAEGNFLKRGKVNAFEALVESLAMLRKSIEIYDARMTLQIIRPNEAKRNVGTVIRKGMTKDDAKDAIVRYLKHKEVDTSNIDLSELDEHAIDSLVVGYGFVEDILNATYR